MYLLTLLAISVGGNAMPTDTTSSRPSRTDSWVWIKSCVQTRVGVQETAFVNAAAGMTSTDALSTALTLAATVLPAQVCAQHSAHTVHTRAPHQPPAPFLP